MKVSDMEFEERQSGIVVPKNKPQQPSHQYGQLEIQDEKRRALAVEALSKLWDAMNLSSPGGGIRLPDNLNYETYRQATHLIRERENANHRTERIAYRLVRFIGTGKADW